ncbi:MAG: TonB-dependent receptor [Flavobacteriaceae bacterium]|nr:TonB-dependent receptor [Flavobacteriaceae bacterium]
MKHSFKKSLLFILLLLSWFSYSQTRTISGVVTGNDNTPLPGAAVQVKNSSVATVTDFDGKFSLSVPDDNGTTLLISFLGYESKEVVIGVQSYFEIALTESQENLDEIVIIGYGTTRKENLTGSVGSVKGEALVNIPSSRIDQVLQGRISGVHVTQTNGAPGASSIIRIRGGNSIQGNNDPLYVIDGFIAGNDFNLNNLNSSDIQSVEILKDATAVSIYGTRGANGVVLITTKTGKGISPGIPSVSINMYTGMQKILNKVEFLDGPQHAAYANEDAEFRNTVLPFPDIANVPNINWLEQITHKAPVSNVDVSVSGQSEKRNVKYYVSGNYFDQQGIIRGSGIKKYIFRSNLDLEISDKFDTGLKMNVSRINREQNKVNLDAALYSAGLPNRAIYNEDGTFTDANPVSASIARNPEADIQLRQSNNQITNVFGNFYLQYEPIKSLIFKSTFGTELNYNKDNFYLPAALPENLATNEGGSGSVGYTSSVNFLNENTLSYSTSFNDDHTLDLLAGFTWQTFRAEGNFAEGFGFANDVLSYNDLANGSDPTRNVIGTAWDSFQLVSWLTRAHYDFKNKYLLTLVGRVDGSSRFATSDNAYAFFPSAAVAWKLGEEQFIKDLNTFSTLKLRLSYGYSGSQAIESFRSLAILRGESAYFNDIIQYAVQNGRPANDNLKWETTRQLDIGLETGFFDNKLKIELDYYHKTTEDLLLNVQIPRQTGFTSKLQNLGSIENKGLELNINSTNVSNENFKWTTTLTLSGNRSKVLDLGGVDFIDIASPTSGGPAARLIVGEPIPVFMGVDYLGTWKTQDEIDASGISGQTVGGPRYRDTNEDGTISEEDFRVLGTSQPDFIGGFQNSISWKNFNLDIYFQGTYGNEVFNILTQSAFFGRPESNKYIETLDRWTPDNQTSDIPRAGAVATLADVKNNSQMVEDGSHLRLKNITIGYNLPVKKLGFDTIKSANIYFSGSNLFLISNFRLFDPETNFYGGDNITSGFSRGEYPYGRTLMLGLNVTF